MTDATVVLDPTATVAPVRRRLFGSFVEHLGRCVYTGLYEPSHPSADADGFRTDVIDLVRELGSTTIRYPGGNFVSGYRWEDGIGPRDQRPSRLDLAWHSLETNQVGIDEFARWCHATGSELMLAVNLGTRGVLEALDLLDYTNTPDGTWRAEQRAANGSVEPYDVRMWCLGNEMDGPWQVGRMSSEDYGKLAARTAAAMKMVDPNLELVVCGSSSSSMPTFGDWERIVLENAYESVDFISCHAYYQQRNGDLGSFLASSLDMQYFIETVAATVDHVKHKLRSTKTVQLSFDEWNIWYQDEFNESGTITEGWPAAPRLIEDVYTVADAVVLGNLLITLLQHSDRVTSASLAQLVNVIAPIMTEPGGDAWRQTTFFPFSTTSRLAAGEVLRPRIDAPTYPTAVHGEAPLIDAVATFESSTGQGAVFIVNRDQSMFRSVTIDVAALGATAVHEAQSLWDDDITAKNTRDQQDRVRLRHNETARLEHGQIIVSLPPVSWTAVSFS